MSNHLCRDEQQEKYVVEIFDPDGRVGYKSLLRLVRELLEQHNITCSKARVSYIASVEEDDIASVEEDEYNE